MSARKRKHGRTGDAGTYIKPMLVQAAWNAIRVRGPLQARYNRLVRRFGGQKNPAAKKKAITAIRQRGVHGGLAHSWGGPSRQGLCECLELHTSSATTSSRAG
jgi:hypothetical protein